MPGSLEWLRGSRALLCWLVEGYSGVPSTIWLHPDPLSLDSFVLSHSLDIKTPPGKQTSVLGYRTLLRPHILYVKEEPPLTPKCMKRHFFCSLRDRGATTEGISLLFGVRVWEFH